MKKKRKKKRDNTIMYEISITFNLFNYVKDLMNFNFYFSNVISVIININFFFFKCYIFHNEFMLAN